VPLSIAVPRLEITVTVTNTPNHAPSIGRSGPGRTRAAPLLFHSVAHSRKERWEDRQLSCFMCSRW
jgi:hypothetical protein